MRIFIVGAIVLIVFMIIATAATTGELFGVLWYTWLGASILSYLVDVLLGGVLLGSGGFIVGQRQQQ
jgi:F0F1-type ATP synthase assembly protein I